MFGSLAPFYLVTNEKRIFIWSSSTFFSWYCHWWLPSRYREGVFFIFIIFVFFFFIFFWSFFLFFFVFEVICAIYEACLSYNIVCFCSLKYHFSLLSHNDRFYGPINPYPWIFGTITERVFWKKSRIIAGDVTAGTWRMKIICADVSWAILWY